MKELIKKLLALIGFATIVFLICKSISDTFLSGTIYGIIYANFVKWIEEEI